MSRYVKYKNKYKEEFLEVSSECLEAAAGSNKDWPSSEAEEASSAAWTVMYSIGRSAVAASRYSTGSVFNALSAKELRFQVDLVMGKL